MNTKSSNKDLDKIQEEFDKLFNFESETEKQEADAQLLMARFLSKVQEVTDEKNIKRKELAEMIGTSASYLTQLYRGTKNLNFLTIAKIQNALGIQFEVSLKDENKDFSKLGDKDIEPFLNKWIKEKEGEGYMKIYKNKKSIQFPKESNLEYSYSPSGEGYNSAS